MIYFSEGLGVGMLLGLAYLIYYRRTVVMPLFKAVEELAPWYQTKLLQDAQDAVLASMPPNDQQEFNSGKFEEKQVQLQTSPRLIPLKSEGLARFFVKPYK